MDHVFDLGNTAVKYARYLDGKRMYTERIAKLSDAFFGELPFDARTDRAIFCTTRTLSKKLQSGLHRMGAHELSHRDPFPFSIAYATPETLGRDRLAAVAGAFAEFPGRNVLILDAGTCLTYEWLTAEGIYRGGNISPGLHMRLDAMATFTAKLPRVDAQLPAPPIGDSTESALQNGALRGLLYEVRGALAWTKEQFPDPIILATGGGGAFLAEHLEDVQYRPHLVLDGLAAVLQRM